MAKLTSNQNVKVVWILEADLTDPDHPSATELNADGIDISQAISFDGYELGATDSDSNDDRALTDLGSAVTRGFANYAATLPFFYDADFSDTGSVYNDAFDAFRTELTTGYLVTRVGWLWSANFADADIVSVYKFTAGAVSNDISGDSYKFQVDFLPQGELYVNTLVDSASAIVALPATDSIATGEYTVIGATINGVDVTHSCTYVSADTTKCTVSDLGIVSWVSAGGPTTVTVSHPSANASDTVAITTT